MVGPPEIQVVDSSQGPTLQVGLSMDSSLRPSQVLRALANIVSSYVNSYCIERSSFLGEDTVLCHDRRIGGQDTDGCLFLPLSLVKYLLDHEQHAQPYLAVQPSRRASHRRAHCDLWIYILLHSLIL